MNFSSGERSTKQPLSQVRYVFGFQERTASSEKVLVIQPISNSRLCGMRLHKESYDLPMCLLFRAVSAGELAVGHRQGATALQTDCLVASTPSCRRNVKRGSWQMNFQGNYSGLFWCGYLKCNTACGNFTFSLPKAKNSLPSTN